MTPLKTCEVSVELYILFRENPNVNFTVTALVDIVNLRYKTNLTIQRVYQILTAMENRGRITRIDMNGITGKRGYTRTWTLSGGHTKVLYGSPEHKALTILIEKGNGSTSSRSGGSAK